MSQRASYQHSLFSYMHLTCVLVCLSEDLLKVDGMDMKIAEPITAAHLINAAILGNSRADAVLKKGQSTDTHTDLLKKN